MLGFFILVIMTKLLLLASLLCITFGASAQLTENFSDGNITANPAWAGNTADWTVNASNQLQSNNTTANANFYLSTPNSMATATQWEFYTRLAFNTSSANYADVFLTANAADLSANSTTGYFVRIGNTGDEIALYRKDAGGAVVKIIDGVDGITNTSNNTLKIKVTRSSANTFSLYRDETGTGNTYVSEGSATDATYTTSAHFGFYLRQSTAAFFQRHYFDDIIIQAFVPDVTPPAIQTLTALSSTTLDVVFTESVDLASGQTLTNFNVNNGIGNPASAVRDAGNTALVHLSFNASFANGANHTLTINGVKDLAGNTLTNGSGIFSFYIPQRYDVVIDEIFADPTPPIGLPNAEYIEIKNTSGKTLELGGWRMASPTTTSAAFPPYSLPADSFLILSATSNAALFSSFGRTLGIGSFPSLDNDGTTLTLTSKEGALIHAVAYTKAWYNNAVKSEGGWSLEMIDTRNPCAGSFNWNSSTAAAGGTPGRRNSVDGTSSDQAPPQLLRTYSIDSVTVIAVFNESLDSLSAVNNSSYSFTNGITVSSATPQSPLFNTVLLKTTTPLQKRTVYELSVTGVKDCKGTTIGAFNKARAGVAEEALVTDVVINEILFNPRSATTDFVEFYNRSNKVFDASKLYVANRNSSGAISALRNLNETPFYIFPEDYIVITEDAASLQMDYVVKNTAWLLTASSLPSFPDDKGVVALVNGQGAVVDEVAYTEKWHFPLITNAEGVSLERIEPGAASGAAGNWHSAASTAGFATPTYKNSQYKQTEAGNATITVSPKVFSPDNDGQDDVATLQYSVEASGYTANVTIFDAAGRPVRYLVKNGVLGLKGSWNWDGLSEKSAKLPIGTYVIFTELFNLEGKKMSFKNTVVLGRRLN
ncbi:MAG: hypothetical protein JWP69_428 [Flaviaesturariibacter sp.]|nr:hypothetical protein [Flaviaesturariibacter sp.]